jgi:hypothetical protein
LIKEIRMWKFHLVKIKSVTFRKLSVKTTNSFIGCPIRQHVPAIFRCPF